MGKGQEWSESEIIQLCRSWLETSENADRGTGQKKKTFTSGLYAHWLENKSDEATEDRSEIAVIGRWKKLQPEATKFCGVYSKWKSRERSGWSEDMYLNNSMKIYAERHKQPSEFLAAWKELKDMPKWTTKFTSDDNARAKRKAGGDDDLARSEGRKAAKQKQKNLLTVLPLVIQLIFGSSQRRRKQLGCWSSNCKWQYACRTQSATLRRSFSHWSAR
ncbi:hypothetical protein PHMEG_00012796 [Phytophthora megakarya]|uniref:No apical meristem-associated C-terminal domain-containing protein n=1 Tax=Phytophthora megakarya TaxID=4795 RepID=A0A225W9Z3_9STRA|nr:hypothetical protein PHMEG_00012796 [Phytophthora megakarya]